MLNNKEQTELYRRLTITQEDLEALHSLCSPSDNPNTFHTSSVEDLEEVMWRLLINSGVKTGANILDLGSGLGFPSLVFAYAGLRAYGVDENPEVLRASAWNIGHAAELIGKEFEHKPVLMLGQYNNGFSLRTFSDGVSPRKMDVFFGFCYIDGHEPLAESLYYAADGAILALPQRMFEKEFLKKNEFRPINPRDKESYLVKDRLLNKFYK